jgi:hypothetical protein
VLKQCGSSQHLKYAEVDDTTGGCLPTAPPEVQVGYTELKALRHALSSSPKKIGPSASVAYPLPPILGDPKGFAQPKKRRHD